MTHACPPEGDCEFCEAVAARADMWAAGPERQPRAVTTTVETSGGAIRAPAIADPETQRAMAMEAAGYERDPVTGEYRHGTWDPA